MTSHDKDRRLLADAFAEMACEDVRAASLAATLACARRQRARRRGARMTAGALTVCAAAALMWRASIGGRPPSATAPSGRAPAKAAERAPMIEGTSIRVLSDEELLGFFPGRPTAFLGTGDDLRLVLLDSL